MKYGEQRYQDLMKQIGRYYNRLEQQADEHRRNIIQAEVDKDNEPPLSDGARQKGWYEGESDDGFTVYCNDQAGISTYSRPDENGDLPDDAQITYNMET